MCSFSLFHHVVCIGGSLGAALVCTQAEDVKRDGCGVQVQMSLEMEVKGQVTQILLYKPNLRPKRGSLAGGACDLPWEAQGQKHRLQQGKLRRKPEQRKAVDWYRK